MNPTQSPDARCVADHPTAQVLLAAAKADDNHTSNADAAGFIHQTLMMVSCAVHSEHMAGTELHDSCSRQHGPGDSFHPKNSHAIPALLQRVHEAKLASAPELVIWGSGTPMREFPQLDDMGAASVHVVDLTHEVCLKHTQPMDSHINVGTGVECTIRELAETSMQVVGHVSRLVWDRNKPAVTPCKMMDVSPLATLGRRAQVGLADGSQEACRSLLLHHAEARL